MKNGFWFVYIIQNEKGHFYTGITTDVERRFNEHFNSKKGAKFFSTGKPVSLVFQKKFPDRSTALKFEYYLKSLKRDQKVIVIKEGMK